MFIENDRISLRQMRRMLMIEIFSASSLLLPSLIVRGQNGNGLLPLFCGSVLAMGYVTFFLWFIKKLNGSYLQTMRENLEKGGLFSVGVIYYLRFFANQVFLIILFGKLIQVSVLPGYTVLFLIGPILFFTFYCSINGFEGRARILELLFPYIFFPLLLVLVLAIGGVQFSNFSSSHLSDSSAKQLILTTYAVFLSYRGIEFLLFLAPQVVETERKVDIFKSAYGSTFLIVLLNSMIYIITIGMFGIYSTRETWWSALNIMQAVRLPGGFVERLDILLVVFWIFSMFSVFSAYFFYGWKMLETGIPSLERHRMLVMGVSLLAVFGSVFFFEHIPDLITKFYRYLMGIDFLLAVLIPVFVVQKRKWFG